MYIEREAVINKRRRMSEYDEAGWCVTCQAVSVEDIGNIPSADVVEVKHGKWIDVEYNYFGAKRYMCNQCSADDFWRKRYICIKEKYCPNCGAKMDGDTNA